MLTLPQSPANAPQCERRNTGCATSGAPAAQPAPVPARAARDQRRLRVGVLGRALSIAAAPTPGRSGTPVLGGPVPPYGTATPYRVFDGWPLLPCRRPARHQRACVAGLRCVISTGLDQRRVGRSTPRSSPPLRALFGTGADRRSVWWNSSPACRGNNSTASSHCTPRGVGLKDK